MHLNTKKSEADKAKKVGHLETSLSFPAEEVETAVWGRNQHN